MQELTEDKMLQAYFDWVQIKGSNDERYRYIFHVPNEAKRTFLGHIIAKRKGLAKGMPDILGLYATAKGKGLAIEAKTIKGRITPDQEKWLRRLDSIGWHCRVARSLDEMIKITEEFYG